jgi:hypothetical protein
MELSDLILGELYFLVISLKPIFVEQLIRDGVHINIIDTMDSLHIPHNPPRIRPENTNHLDFIARPELISIVIVCDQGDALGRLAFWD